MKPISLVKNPDYDAPSPSMPCCGDDYGTRVYLSGPKDLADLPESGTIVFKYERKSVTVSDEKDPVRMELKLLSIEGAKEGDVSDMKPKKRESEEDASSAVDRLFAEMQDDVED